MLYTIQSQCLYCFRHRCCWDRRPFGSYFRSLLVILKCSKRQDPCLLQVSNTHTHAYRVYSSNYVLWWCLTWRNYPLLMADWVRLQRYRTLLILRFAYHLLSGACELMWRVIIKHEPNMESLFWYMVEVCGTTTTTTLVVGRGSRQKSDLVTVTSALVIVGSWSRHLSSEQASGWTIGDIEWRNERDPLDVKRDTKPHLWNCISAYGNLVHSAAFSCELGELRKSFCAVQAEVDSIHLQFFKRKCSLHKVSP